MNYFIRLMNGPDYQRREREAHEDAAYRQKERMQGRNAALEQHGKPTPQQIRDSIAGGRRYSFEHDLERSVRGRDRNGTKGKITKQLSASVPMTRGEGSVNGPLDGQSS